MLVCQRRCLASARGTFDESFLDEVRLIDILNRAGIFAHGGSDGVESDRSATELIDDGREQFVIYLIEAESIDIQRLEGILGDVEIDRAVAFDLGEVSHASQEGVSYTGRTA